MAGDGLTITPGSSGPLRAPTPAAAPPPPPAPVAAPVQTVARDSNNLTASGVSARDMEALPDLDFADLERMLTEQKHEADQSNAVTTANAASTQSAEEKQAQETAKQEQKKRENLDAFLHKDPALAPRAKALDEKEAKAAELESKAQAAATPLEAANLRQEAAALRLEAAQLRGQLAGQAVEAIAAQIEAEDKRCREEIDKLARSANGDPYILDAAAQIALNSKQEIDRLKELQATAAQTQAEAPAAEKAAAEKLEAAKQTAFGEKLVQEARNLANQEGGYLYGNTGVCTNFVMAALEKAGATVPGKDTLAAIRCADQVAYFKELERTNPEKVDVMTPGEPGNEMDPVKGPAGCQPGDLIYWGPDHVAMVTRVDEAGHPLEIAHAHGFTHDSSGAVDQNIPATVNPFRMPDPNNPGQEIPWMDPDPRSYRSSPGDRTGNYQEFHNPATVTAIVRPKAG